MLTPIRLGTRPSKLALKQAEIIKNKFKNHTKRPIQIISIASEGDQNINAPISEIGGKGIFIKTIETALLENQIDIAVHSFKDITTAIPNQLVLSGFLEPESCRDTILSPNNITLTKLPKNATIGTSSARRMTLIKHLRPDLIIKPIRGNINTPIEAMKTGKYDAIILSEAVIIRLNLGPSQPLDPTQFIPAPGQGIIALENRKLDKELTHLCQKISHPETHTQATAIYSFLDQIGLGCGYPLGLYIQNHGESVTIHYMVAAENGENPIFEIKSGRSDQLKDLLAALPLPQ